MTATASTALDWRRAWVFACLADALAEDGAHLTVDLPALSLTVQSFRGRLAAFWNVCSHRAIQMRLPGRGQGLLRCPYHGWTYNAEGVPVGIPDNDLFFGITREERRALALRPAEVAACGRLLWLRAEPGGPPLEAALGPDFADLAALEIEDAWTVAAAEHASPQPLPPVPVAGRPTVAMAEGWTLVSSVLPQDDGQRRRLALLHPDRPPLDRAPARFRAAIEATCRG